MLKSFWLTFIPLFIAVDAMGTLPLFLALTKGVDRRRLRSLVAQSVATALVVGLLFLVVGNQLLKVLGITIADFMIAGGVLLFMFSVSDLLTVEKRQHRIDPTDLGAVPLGVPLIAGPAVLTAGLLLVDEHGLPMTALSLGVNVLIAGTLFWFAGAIERLLGKTGAKIISKLAALLLAAFAVMMVRKGILWYR